MNKRERLIDDLVIELTEIQSQDSYYFDEDSASIVWVAREQGYYLLRSNQTWQFATPGRVSELVEELSTQALEQWLEAAE